MPYAYFLTLTTYGSWLPGDNRLSVDKRYNQINISKKRPNSFLSLLSSQAQTHESCYLNRCEREIVLTSAMNTCSQYDWHLFAAHDIFGGNMHYIL